MFFCHENKSLSIRSPEATSLGKATRFNRHNFGKFFTYLKSVMERYNFPPNKIYNIDETGLMTVHKPPKVIPTKGEKQVGQVASSERGTLVTMLIGAPTGTIGAANPSGWINSSIFETWLHHFIDHSNSIKDNPTLLVMDNHC